MSDTAPVEIKTYYTIGEVSEMLNVPQHVLRRWEDRFDGVQPIKRRGRRYYHCDAIPTLRAIRSMLAEGLHPNDEINRLTKTQKKPLSSQTMDNTEKPDAPSQPNLFLQEDEHQDSQKEMPSRGNHPQPLQTNAAGSEDAGSEDERENEENEANNITKQSGSIEPFSYADIFAVSRVDQTQTGTVKEQEKHSPQSSPAEATSAAPSPKALPAATIAIPDKQLQIPSSPAIPVKPIAPAPKMAEPMAKAMQNPLIPKELAPPKQAPRPTPPLHAVIKNGGAPVIQLRTAIVSHPEAQTERKEKMKKILEELKAIYSALGKSLVSANPATPSPKQPEKE